MRRSLRMWIKIYTPPSTPNFICLVNSYRNLSGSSLEFLISESKDQCKGVASKPSCHFPDPIPVSPTSRRRRSRQIRTRRSPLRTGALQRDARRCTDRCALTQEPVRRTQPCPRLSVDAPTSWRDLPAAPPLSPAPDWFVAPIAGDSPLLRAVAAS